MKVVICLNGEQLKKFDFDKNDYIIACDGGYNHLMERNVTPDIVLGDFDSLGYIPENAITYSSDKDYTDGELGLLKAIDLGAKTVEFICAGGNREDQFFANVGLLEKAARNGVSAKCVTNASDIYFVDNSITINTKKETVVSVYPLETSVIKSSYGLKYKYNNTLINRGDTVGISNVAVDDTIGITVSKGAVLVFINRNLA